MKFQLIIAGTKEEIERAREHRYGVSYLEYNDYDRNNPEIHCNFSKEFKVVEPFRYTFETTADELGAIGLMPGGGNKLVFQGSGALAGKKIRVTMEEVE